MPLIVYPYRNTPLRCYKLLYRCEDVSSSSTLSKVTVCAAFTWNRYFYTISYDIISTNPVSERPDRSSVERHVPVQFLVATDFLQ